MFHTNIYKTESHPDLQIAERKGYQNQINMLRSDLGKACTPEQLEKAELIAEKFRESLVFKYISAENSIVNAVVWKSHGMAYDTAISFELNGKPITVRVPAERIIRVGGKYDTINKIKAAICEAVAKELTQHVYVEVIKKSLPLTPKERRENQEALKGDLS